MKKIKKRNLFIALLFLANEVIKHSACANVQWQISMNKALEIWAMLRQFLQWVFLHFFLVPLPFHCSAVQGTQNKCWYKAGEVWIAHPFCCLKIYIISLHEDDLGCNCILWQILSSSPHPLSNSDLGHVISCVYFLSTHWFCMREQGVKCIFFWRW